MRLRGQTNGPPRRATVAAGAAPELAGRFTSLSIPHVIAGPAFIGI
jgi:hypothetical protein